MPETRIVETAFGLGGYDPTKPNNNIVEEIIVEVSDEELHQEELDKEMNDTHIQLFRALDNWDSLSAAQIKQIVKHLVRYRLHKEGQL